MTYLEFGAGNISPCSFTLGGLFIAHLSPLFLDLCRLMHARHAKAWNMGLSMKLFHRKVYLVVNFRYAKTFSKWISEYWKAIKALAYSAPWTPAAEAMSFRSLKVCKLISLQHLTKSWQVCNKNISLSLATVNNIAVFIHDCKRYVMVFFPFIGA